MECIRTRDSCGNILPYTAEAHTHTHEHYTHRNTMTRLLRARHRFSTDVPPHNFDPTLLARGPEHPQQSRSTPPLMRHTMTAKQQAARSPRVYALHSALRTSSACLRRLRTTVDSFAYALPLARFEQPVYVPRVFVCAVSATRGCARQHARLGHSQ